MPDKKSSFERAFEDAAKDLDSLMKERAVLDEKISRYKETVQVLSKMVDLTEERKNLLGEAFADIVEGGLTFTDSVRQCVESSDEDLTAMEVRDIFLKQGTGEGTNLLPTIHTILKRLQVRGELAYGKMKDGKVSYRGIKKT